MQATLEQAQNTSHKTISKVLFYILATCLFLLCTNIVQAKVYKWVTEDGTVVYSDQPHPEAEVLNIEPLHPYKTPEYTPPESQPTVTNTPEVKVKSHAKYVSANIDSPEHQQTITGTAGSFTVSVSSNPSLLSGDKYQLIIDGKALGEPTTLTSFNVQNIDRGQHSISVQILNRQGNPLISSPSVTIHIKRPVVNRKQAR